MMSKQHPHPTTDELSAFSLGQLPQAEAASIESHVSHCEPCCETLLSLAPDDTFVGLLQEAKRTPSETVAIDGAENQPAEAAEVPAQLAEHPRYEIVGLIGKGGMGDVFKARHRMMERTVALKVIKHELVRKPEAVERFHREVQAAARLHDRNIVTAYDAEQAGGLHFLVMEFVDGVNLDEVVRQRGPLPVDQACDYVRQAALGLQHAHESGMVHRDIKPHNLMLAASGDVKILDFGLASFASEFAADELNEQAGEQIASVTPATGQLTQMGTMMGTPDYIAPEQAVDAHTADIRADIYSLGCTFFTLLTGRPPFVGNSILAKIKAHAEQAAPPLADFRDDVPAEVEAVLRKMIAKDPAERFQTPAEVASALASCSPVLPTPKPQVSEKSAYTRRRPLVLTAVAALFLALLTAAVLYIQTDYGVVRVEVANESLQVQLNGRTIEMKDGQTPLSIRTGQQRLVVKRGDFEFETNDFQLRRGDRIAFKVELLPGEVVVLKDGERFGVKALPNDSQRDRSSVQPLVIGMNEKGVPTFDGRLVPPHELSDRLIEALKENPDREVAIDLPKRPWTVAPHVDQLEGIARIAGAKHVTRPAWSESPQATAGEITLVGKFKAHTDGISDVLVTSDGRQIVSASNDRTIRVWDRETGETVRRLSVGSGVTAIALSSDEKLLAAGCGGPIASKSGEIVVWNFQDGKQWKRIAGHGAIISSLAFSPSGKQILTTGQDGIARLWDIETGRELKRYEVTTSGIVEHGAFLSDRMFLTVTRGSGVQIWDTERDHPVQTFAEDDRPTAAAVSPDGSRLAVASEPGTFRIMDMASGRELRQFTGVRDAYVTQVAFLPDGQHLLSVEGTALRLWDIDRGQETGAATAPGHVFQVMALAPDGRSAMTGGGWTWDASAKQITVSGDYAMCQWRLPERVGPESEPDGEGIDLAGELTGHTGPVRSVRFLPDSRQLVSVGEEGAVLYWDLKSKQAVGRVEVADWLGDGTISRDGRLVAFRTSSGTRPADLEIWDLSEKKRLHQLQYDHPYTPDLHFSPDGSTLLVTGLSDLAVLFNVSSGEEVQRFSFQLGPKIDSACFTPDGSAIALASFRGVETYAAKTGKLLHQIELPPGGSISDLTFRSDGEQLVAVRNSGHVSLLDVKTGAVLQQFLAADDADAAHRAALLSNGRLLATTSQPDRLVIRDLSTGQIVATTALAKGLTWELDVSSDGRYLVTAGGAAWDKEQKTLVKTGDYALRLWRLPESVWPDD